MIAVLSGGVGGARLLQGLAATLPPDELVAIVNTGDDEEFYGLHVSPDIDIVLYHLAGIVDEEKGWGIRRDSFSFLNMMSTFGFETWFKIGDRDLATHVFRTQMLSQGHSLAEATRRVSDALSVKVKVLPMTNQAVRTRVHTEHGTLSFQEYFVQRGGRDSVKRLEFDGAEDALPAPGVEDAIRDAEAVMIAPSNPLLSLGPMLAIRQLKEAVHRTRALVLGVSPIIEGKAVKGPAVAVMRGLGLDASAVGVGRFYSDLLDILVVDRADEALVPLVEELGVNCLAVDTMMTGLEKRVDFAQQLIWLVRGG